MTREFFTAYCTTQHKQVAAIPTYTIPGIKLLELKKQPKNLLEDVNVINTIIAYSARFVDNKSGETLICVFSYRVSVETNTTTITKGKTGVREIMITEAKITKAKVIFLILSDKTAD